MTTENEQTTEQERTDDFPENFLVFIERGNGNSLKMVDFMEALNIKANPESFTDSDNNALVAAEIGPQCNVMREKYERGFHERKIKIRRALWGIFVKGKVFYAMEMSPPVIKEQEKKELPKFKMDKSSDTLISAK